MKGLWIEDGAVTYRQDLPAPTPQPDHTRVRVVQAGVCATDLALRAGYMGFVGVPGHEFVGVAVDGPLTGQRVVGEINAACGQCAWCARGDDRHCPSRSVLGILNHAGAFAEELILPSRNLLAVPDGVSDAAATFTEPLAAALHIPAEVDVRDQDCLVLGDGRLGLLCAWALFLSGAARVRVSGRHPDRQRLLPDAVLFTESVDPSFRWEGERADVVVEATGRGELLEAAVARCRPRGTLVLKSTAAAAASLNLWQVVVDEIHIVGSRCGRFGPALDALATDELPVEGFIDAVFPLEAGPEAFQKAGSPGALKVLLRMEE